MPEDDAFITRLFLATGGVLAVLGGLLWLVLPFRPTVPPYLSSALLALAYGVYVWSWARPKS
ncbi:MAG: hypothetical protein WDO13_11450 [Verrucomicrobiota bacterium]